MRESDGVLWDQKGVYENPPPPRNVYVTGQAGISRKCGFFRDFPLRNGKWGKSGLIYRSLSMLPAMSAFGGKADIFQGVAKCPLIAISGHWEAG